MDRRALFFLTAAALAGGLSLVMDDLIYVPRILAAVYLVLAFASWLDWRTNNRARPVEDQVRTGERPGRS